MSSAALLRSLRHVRPLTSRSLLNRHATPSLPLSIRFETASQKASLSTKEDVKPQKAPASKLDSKSENPSYPAFSLEGLGANRTVKYVVYGALSVLGTIETVFWVQTLWAKFSPSREDGSRPEET